MRVEIYCHADDTFRALEGTDASVAHQIMLLFPWLRDKNPGQNNVQRLIERIDTMQNYEATASDTNEINKSESEAPNLRSGDVAANSSVVEDMLGHRPDMLSAFDAARFLMGAQPLSLDTMRRALWIHDGDYEKAALAAYGAEPNEKTLKALRGVRKMKQLQKHIEPLTTVPKDIHAINHDGGETEDHIRRAFEHYDVFPVKLGGKHSAGTLLAHDEESGVSYLLKPGSGGQSPAAGVQEEGASQSEREVAFWHVADQWHLGDTVPRADLVSVDGKLYAAIQMLSYDYKNLDKRKKEDPNIAPRTFSKYLKDGLIHRWAILDFVLGNPDRHANNIMVNEAGNAMLIDHGSAAAGVDFDPANDQNSFVPYYLRAWAPDWQNAWTTDQKLAKLPRVHVDVARAIKTWLDEVDEHQLAATLESYQIDPQPMVMRLQKLKAMSAEMPVDEAINKLWVTT